MCRWLEYNYITVERTEKTSTPGPKLECWLRDAGFVICQRGKIRCTNRTLARSLEAVRYPPSLTTACWLNEYQKNLGAYNLTQLYEGLQDFSLRTFTKVLGRTQDEVEALLVDVCKDLQNRNIHAMFA